MLVATRVVEAVAGEVDGAALPRAAKEAARRRLELLVGGGADESQAVQAAGDQRAHELGPARSRLPDFDAEHLAPTLG